MKRGVAMSKLIHLSDLHIGHKELGKRAWAIANRIILNKPQAENYVIVLTGDLVESGFDENALAEALALVEHFQTSGFSVLVAPGNHDVGNGAFATKKASKRFLRLFFGSKKARFPRRDIIHDTAFIGLNSMEAETGFFSGGLSAEGELGKKQLKRLSKLLNEDNIKNAKYRVVYLHHHPVDHRFLLHLKDAKELRKTLQGHAIDALLFGHYHEALTWNGSWEDISRIYDAGSSTSKDEAKYPHRVMDLSKHPSTDYDGDFLPDSIRSGTHG